MKRLILTVGLAGVVSGCIPTAHETVAVTCSEYIGRPISERIAVLGPPKAVHRISPTQLGYIFETTETTFHGGYTYYTVNYMIGADKHRTAIYPVTTTCRGMFVVLAPSDATPVSQRIIVDVR